MLLLQHPSSSSKPRGGSSAMVVTWFSELRRSLTSPENHHHHHYLNPQNNHSRWINTQEKPETLGILAFDTAKTIARLISLYKSLSDEEFLRLRKHVMRGKGISYLTSEDDGFLLTLACSERLEDLDRAASAVARLGHKCSDYGLVRFDQVYKDLKNGYVDLEKLASYGSKEMEKCIDKMERLATQTGNLYAELESLSELEVSERKLCEWKKRDSMTNNNGNTNYDLFDQKLLNQRKLVRQLKEVSLWSQSHDKIVGLMAKMVCVLYARICALFGPYISILPSKKGCFGGPSNNNNNNKKQRKILTPEMSQRLFSDPSPHTTMSGPLTSPGPRVPLVRFLSRESPISITDHVVGATTNNKVFQAAPPSTVGGSGLAVRYANVILLSLRYLNTESLIGDQARHNLYNMLPMSLKTYVRTKLRAAWREAEEEDNGGGDALAEGWREAVKGILEWLAPMAEDTLTWQTERNMEKQKFDAKPTVLLLQTLHYADLEKTEAAIAEVLVGLSCIYWYENRRLSCVDIY